MGRGGYDMSVDFNGVVETKNFMDVVKAQEKELVEAIKAHEKEEKAARRRPSDLKYKAKMAKEAANPQLSTNQAGGPSSGPRASDYGRTWGELPQREYKDLAPKPDQAGPAGDGAGSKDA